MIMKLYLERFAHSSYGTTGELFLLCDDCRVHLCYTLEPSEESKDLFGALPIEAGEYKISITHSPRFNKMLPYVWHPNRSGIRFHAGNSVQDTQGCILTGLYFSKHNLVKSCLSLNHVITIIREFNITKLQISEIYGKVPHF